MVHEHFGYSHLRRALPRGMRAAFRSLTRQTSGAAPERLRRTLVFGAGEGGTEIVASMLTDPDSPFTPVAVLDDDPSKGATLFDQVPVVGSREALSDAARDFQADTLLIAVPSAGSELIRELVETGRGLGLDLRILPSPPELIGSAPAVGDIRTIRPSDVLRRHRVEIDLNAVSTCFAGTRVLVTGAGGSIGSEICRQLSRMSPQALLMLDRDESALHALQMSLEGRALLDTRELVLCDIRDVHRLDEVFAEHRPDVVVHAAALKHLPLLEMHPAEALKTNVWGTQNVLDAALRHGIQKLVNISTDKAADPTSVLGYSKRIAERLTAGADRACPAGTYNSVRFGNVLGSRGSVLGAFIQQIEQGGPVTVTDPEVTRYFMLVEEAAALVLQSAAVAEKEEVLILDMGSPVRIADMADQLIAFSGKPIRIEFTGLRPGEKMHEDLTGAREADRRLKHPLISHTTVPALSPHALGSLTLRMPAAQLVDSMRRLCAAPDTVMSNGRDVSFYLDDGRGGERRLVAAEPRSA